MINFSSIYERLKAKIAFCFPVSHVSFSTNNTPDEEGMAMFVNKGSDKFLAISDGTGGTIELRHHPIPPPTVYDELGTRAIISGVVQSKYEFASYEWVNSLGSADQKKWDLVLIDDGLYLRSVADNGAVQVGWKLTRVAQYVQHMNIPSKLQVGGSGAPGAILQVAQAGSSAIGEIVFGGDGSSATNIVEYRGYDGTLMASVKGNGNVSGANAIAANDFVTKGQLDTALTITSPNATDLPSAITLLNEIKTKLNDL